MEFADYTDLDFRDLTAVTTFRDYAVANNLVLDEGFYKKAIAELPRSSASGTSTVFYSGGNSDVVSGSITSIDSQNFSRIDETDLGSGLR